MNKLLRQFSSEEFDALVSQLKSGNIFQDLTGPIDVSALAGTTKAQYSDRLEKIFDDILDSMVGTNIILMNALDQKSVKKKEQSVEVKASVGISSVKSDAKRKFDDMKQYIASIKTEVKRIVQESNSGAGSMLPDIGSAATTAAGVAVAGAGIVAAGVGLSQYENFGFGVPSKESLGTDTVANADSAIQFFVNKGWTREQAAGIVGNLMVESGNFDPKVISGERRGDGGRAVGIAQWHPDRQAEFRRIMGKSIIGSTLQEQLYFVDWELKNNEKAAGDSLRRAKTATEAAIIVDSKYERSSGEARQQRIQRANQIVQQTTINAETGKGKPTGLMADVLKSIAPKASQITSGFGKRNLKIGSKNHQGIDIDGREGDPVKTIADGVVEFAGRKGGYGNTVIVKHPDGKKTLYAHMASNSLQVKTGDKVKRGQILGGVGSTGTSTGNHLHFEVMDSKGNKLNPLDHAHTMLPKDNKPKGKKTVVQPVIVPKIIRDARGGSLLTPQSSKKREAKSNKGPSFPDFFRR